MAKQETPGKRDPAKSRERILLAATDEFSEKGYDGARVDSIVERCGMSKNLAYHYFGSKDGIFLSVMERMYENMRSHHADLQIKGLPPKEGMRRLIEHTFRHFVDAPEVISLLNSENLYQAIHIRHSDKISKLYAPLLETIDDLLSRGVAEGSFRKGVDPMQLYITISGIGYFYLSNQYTLSAVFKKDLSKEDQIAARLDHIIDVVMGYLRPE